MHDSDVYVNMQYQYYMLQLLVSLDVHDLTVLRIGICNLVMIHRNMILPPYLFQLMLSVYFLFHMAYAHEAMT